MKSKYIRTLMVSKRNGLYKFVILTVLLISVFLSGCKKWYGIPESEDFLSENINYTALKFRPVLGRTSLLGNFVADNSTYPLNFKIVKPRNTLGLTDAFEQILPALIWTSPYTGTETSLDQIEAKRKIELKPVFEIRPSGEFILWSSASSENFASSGFGPDSIYTFDVEVSNKSGTRIIRDIVMTPLRERPYEPSYHIDELTGAPLLDKDLTIPIVRRILPNSLTGMRGATTRRELKREERKTSGSVKTVVQDCYVYFKRVGDGKSITFKFMDKDSIPINPNKFNNTKWDNLLHGFNRRMTPESVTYDVAFPVPLIKMRTPFTNADGSQAYVAFSYNRIGFSGTRETGKVDLSFNLYQEGDWEIIFFFHNETPKFEDE